MTSTTPLSSRHQKHMPSPATSHRFRNSAPLYAMISRMRVLAFPRTVECAEKTMRAVMDTYTAPNRTMLELHELIKSREAAIDPLKEFSEAAREELRTFTSR